MSTQDPATGDDPGGPGAGTGWDEPLSPISPSAANRRRKRRPTDPLPGEADGADGPIYRILDAINQLQAQTTQLSRRVQSLESAIRLAGVDVPDGETAGIPSGPGMGRLRRQAKSDEPTTPTD
jgi:hypothetical protein